MQKLVEHPSVRHCEIIEAQKVDGTICKHLLVYTSLVLDPARSGYDKAAHAGLMAEIHGLLDRRPDLDGADLEGA